MGSNELHELEMKYDALRIRWGQNLLAALESNMEDPDIKKIVEETAKIFAVSSTIFFISGSSMLLSRAARRFCPHLILKASYFISNSCNSLLPIIPPKIYKRLKSLFSLLINLF